MFRFQTGLLVHLFFTIVLAADPDCNCNNNGQCNTNTNQTLAKCLCNENFYGDNCEFTRCSSTEFQSNQCLNNGICVKHIQTGEYSCRCSKPYIGALCEKPLCLDYCYNDGKCDIVDSTDPNVQTRKCNCNDRYTGDRCQFDKCASEISKCPARCFLNSDCKCLCDVDCDYNYCNKMNGTCYEDNGSLACKCKVGYSSPVCSIDDCSGYCFNGGTCVRGKTSIYCQCPPGFNEKRCGYAIYQDEASSSSSSEVPSEYESKRIVIYGLSFTLLICFMAIGAYYAIQKDMVRKFVTFINNYRNNNQSNNNGSIRVVPFIRNGFSFNKLEDEQSIAQNPEQA